MFRQRANLRITLDITLRLPHVGDLDNLLGSSYPCDRRVRVNIVYHYGSASHFGVFGSHWDSRQPLGVHLVPVPQVTTNMPALNAEAKDLGYFNFIPDSARALSEVKRRPSYSNPSSSTLTTSGAGAASAPGPRSCSGCWTRDTTTSS